MNSDEAVPSDRVRELTFGDFALDVGNRKLRRSDGSEVELAARLFDALLYFAERPGQLLGKELLLEALWPGLVVEENNLNQLVLGLRRALGDDAQASRYIQTVPRRGFRFVAEVMRNEVATSDLGRRQAPIEERAPAPPAGRPRSWFRAPVAWVAAALVAVAAVAAWLGPPSWRGAPIAATPTLAVLPFKPLTPTQGDEVLELGMADSMIVRMSAVPGLVVRSIGSMRRYAGAQQDPVRAARELDVRWILDGSVQRAGGRIRISARLLDAKTGTAAWSGTFDDRWEDVFAVQDRISARVAEVLAPRLALSEPLGSSSRGTHSADAYQLYLTARLLAQGLRADDLKKSIELYGRAIATDPTYAQAYAGLSNVHRRTAIGADMQPSLAFVPARQAVERALEIDPTLAEAHAEMGWVRWWYDWDWPAAEQSFRRAIEFNPNAAEAHFGLGHLLCSQQRCDEGFEHVQRARELDPLSLITNVMESSYLLQRGRPAESQSRLDKAMQIEPRFWPAWQLSAALHLNAGRPEEALQALRKAESLAPFSAQPSANLGALLAVLGRQDEATVIATRLIALSRERYVPPMMVASLYCAMREHKEALAWLDRARAARDIHLPFLTFCSVELKDEPAFKALLQAMKLPPWRNDFCAPLQAPAVKCR